MDVYENGVVEKYIQTDSERFQGNFEIYTEDSYEEIKGDRTVDLYMHDDCIEVFYYTNNSYKKSTMGTNALVGISLRLTTEYNTALEILKDLGYVLYARDSQYIYTDCLYSTKKGKDDYLKRAFLGEFIREIWVRENGMKQFSFDDFDSVRIHKSTVDNPPVES